MPRFAKWRPWRTACEMAAEFARCRRPQTDDQFVADCKLPPNERARRLALAVRRTVASYGVIDPSYITADDRYPEQLSALSGWDSIDFIGWVMALEEYLDRTVPDVVFAGLGRTFSVRDLAHCVYLGIPDT